MSMSDVDIVVAKAAESQDFTADEVQTLKEMADVWRALETFGKAANIFRKILAYIGWMIAAYLAVKYAIAEWVKGIR